VTWPDDFVNKVIHGDCLDVMREMPDKSINCCVTSPPYWGLRNYGVDGQLGLEKTPGEYVEKMVVIFREVKRILREDGTLWLNLGDSYATRLAGHGGFGKWTTGGDPAPPSGTVSTLKRSRKEIKTKPKNLVGIPWRVAFALQADGWYLRSDIIWSKPNPMPESVTDRPTKSHEYIFLLSKSRKYYYDAEAIREEIKYSRDPGMHGASNYSNGKRNPENRRGSFKELKGANKRSVWTIATQPYAEAHFATFPEKLIEPCILAGCPEGGIIIDPFIGSGTTAKVAQEMKRDFIGIELNGKYIPLIEKRTAQGVL